MTTKTATKKTATKKTATKTATKKTATSTNLKMEDYQTIKNTEALMETYKTLNRELFQNVLPENITIVQNHNKPREDATSYSSVKEKWTHETGARSYELNIYSDFLHRDAAEVAESVLHEMIHIKNLMLGIKDTTRRGTYHNVTFKNAMAAVGYVMDDEPCKDGFTKGVPNDELRELLEECAPHITMTRDKEEKPASKPRKRATRYVCPQCGSKCQSNDESLNIICGDCNIAYERA